MGVSLVCEGPCNPGLAEYDKLSLAFRKATKRRTSLTFKESRLYTLLIERGRTLRHTPHVPTRGGRFICAVCQTMRRW